MFVRYHYKHLNGLTALKLTSHGVLHYLRSADLSKSFTQKALLNRLCEYLPFLNIFFNRFCSVEKRGVAPHCLYRNSLTLICQKLVLITN